MNEGLLKSENVMKQPHRSKSWAALLAPLVFYGESAFAQATTLVSEKNQLMTISVFLVLFILKPRTEMWQMIFFKIPLLRL